MRRDILGTPITSPVRPIEGFSRPLVKSEKSILEIAVEDTLSPVVVNEAPVIVQDTIKEEVKNIQVKKTSFSTLKLVNDTETFFCSDIPGAIINNNRNNNSSLSTDTGKESKVGDGVSSDNGAVVENDTTNDSTVKNSYNPDNGAVVENNTINDWIDPLIELAKYDVPTKDNYTVDNIIPSWWFSPMNPDEEISIPSDIPSEKPGKPKVLTHIPANIYMTNYSSLQIIVEELMELYKDEIEDENSRYYKLFDTLARVNSTNAFQIFFIFFTNIGREIFTIEDYFMFLDNNELDVNYESIVKYLSEAKSNKVEIMNKRLKEGIYEVYGNLYDYIDRQSLDQDDSIFYRATSLEDELFTASEKFLFKPYIDYFDITAYRNKVQAEKDYWNIISNYNGTFSITSNRQVSMLKKILTLKNYNNTNGLPVFLKKDLNKNLFFNDKDLDLLMTSLLKNTYNKFSLLEVKRYIKAMAEEIVEYYELISTEPFDYSNESVMIPNIEDFLLYKVQKLYEKFTDNTNEEFTDNNTNITYMDFKEINFYYSIMFDFADIDTSYGNPNQIQTRYTTMVDLYDDTRTEVLGLWNYIKINGKYL